MPPPRLKTDKQPTSFFNKELIKKYILDPHYIKPTCCLLFLLEVALNVFVIENVKYTEIDWKAYMQEVEGFLNGTFDYKELRGDTGPLVYPAGFVYIYSIFYYLTASGRNIRLAQYIFLGLYLVQATLTYRLLIKTAKVPPYALLIATVTSYRIHSIFVLRLFNDPIAVILFYASLNLFISNRWVLGSVFYSLAVSVKMNILLYAPCLLIAYLTNLSYLDVLINLLVCGLIQLSLGLPFLLTNAWSYLKGSFDLGRIFEHKWTVNYRFLSREVFESRSFHFLLLFLHVGLLVSFVPIFIKYLSSYAKLNVVTGDIRDQLKSERKRRKRDAKEEKLSKQQKAFLSSFEDQLKAKNGPERADPDPDKLEDRLSKVTQLFVLPFFVANLIGIACARSLHYQFYSWYYHSLLYLVFCTGYKKPYMFLILGLIEYCWNKYPSTDVSSVLLHLSHGALLFGIYKTMRQSVSK